MPIKKERRDLYPANWARISELIRERAGWQCELCPAKQGEPHWKTRSRVILTVHHINGNPGDNRRINLIALCQRCHLRLDLPFKHKRRTIDKPDLLS